MRKTEILKRVLSGMLAFTFCITTSGCGQKDDMVKAGGKEALAQAEKIDKEHIFKQEDIKGILEDGEEVAVIDRKDDRIQVIAQTDNGKCRFVSFNPDGSDAKSFDIKSENKCFTSSAAFDNYGNVYIRCLERIESEDSEEDTDYLIKYDASGKELYRLDLTKEATKDSSEEGSDVMAITWHEKYGLICHTTKGIYTYDEKNGFEKLVELKASGTISDLIKVSDNQLLIYYINESEADMVNLDTKEVVKNPEGLGNESQYTFFTDGGSNLYVSPLDGSGVYKYDMKTSKLDKLLNYSDSNVGLGGQTDIRAAAISDNEFIAGLCSDSGYYDELVRLTKVDPKDVVDKTIITLGTVGGIDSNSNGQIVKFNRSSDKYMIKIVDYCELYPEDPQKQFELDILSGKAPDIFSVSEDMLKNYADKGILMDLTPAFEKDGALGDVEILPNIAEMVKIDGNTYSFMPSFYFETSIVRAKFAGGKKSLTYQDCDNLIKSMGTDYSIAFGGLKKSSFEYIWPFYGDKFIDRKNKKCNFKGPEFIDLLNFMNKFPDELKGSDADYLFIDDKYMADEALFDIHTFYGIDDYVRLKQMVFHDDIEFVGLPNNSGDNIAVIRGDAFAVNSSTSHRDEIYDLIRNMLLSQRGDFDKFSTVKPIFEEQLQEALKERSDDDRMAYAYDQSKQDLVKMKPLTQDEIKKFYDYVLSIKTQGCNDSSICDIVSEETSAFFGGQKTAEEVADLIQNRVTTYLNENS